METMQLETKELNPPTADEGARLQTVASLLPQHLEQLRASGLTDETIQKSGVYSVEDPKEVYRLLNLWPGAEAPVPGLAFPYPGCNDYVRFRPDIALRQNPDYHPPYHEHYNYDVPEFEPGPKYVSPRGQPTRLYAPTALRPEILDANTPLWLIEGEKKALAGCQAGLAMVAAPGVTCFGDTVGKLWAQGFGQDVRKLHPDFDRLGIPLKGRKVIILFDSDIDSNPAVLAAAASLGKMLNAAGADPHIGYLDQADPGQKVGLDDYLVSRAASNPTGPNPVADVEDSVRAFNFEGCLDEYLEPNWDDWNRRHRDRELGRAVKLACHIARRKGDLNKWCQRVAEELREDLDHVRSFIVEVQRTSERDPRPWVETWLDIRKVEVDQRTDQFTTKGQHVDSDTLFREMALDAVTFRGPKRQSLEDAFAVWATNARRVAQKRLQERVKYCPWLDHTQIRKFTVAVTGHEDPVDVAVLAHFIWQVKRKLGGLEVDHHLMTILFGPQGAGKSVALRKLLGPVSEFMDPLGDLGVLSDERQFFRLSRSLVVFVDEMAKAERVDMASLKSRITAETVSWRVLGSNRRSTGKNMATFIGAANVELPDLIVDSTGVRRFYQVTCRNPLDWEAVNTVDYEVLWASVDEGAKSPIVDVLDELRRRQEAMRVKDAVEEFLAQRCTVGGKQWTGGKEVFEAFKDFLGDENLPKQYWTSSRLGRRLKSLLGQDGWKQSNGIKYNVALKTGEGPPVPEGMDAFLFEVAAAGATLDKRPPLKLVTNTGNDK